ncbi:MAG TPA: Tim44/TimA family putative adaptor protein [Stellaceae bacterium]|nr:Tim44/TimA family putative adaptor protein [Stellaceae bacterium]
MGDYQYLDIVLFAVIAGFLILRLRSVLGRRTGNERRRDPFVPSKPDSVPENVVSLPRGRPSASSSPADASAPVSAPAARIKTADPRFDEAAFLAGARGAFEIIVNAFAKGDTAALQPLLSDAVYASFAEAIRNRLAQHETLETNLLAIKAVELADGEIENDTALATVKFVSDQTNVTRAADGSVVDGSPERVVEKTDIWTFSRALRSRDPNWTLVATHSS